MFPALEFGAENIVIMRYKKGRIVEVLSKNEVPSGSWHCAEIICGNGHNYTVRYEMGPAATDEAIVERVSRKSISPCPPPVKLSENCVPGDVAEVFQNFSWKMATVSKVLGRNCFLVRLLGSSHEFKVSKVDLRVRQSWQGGKWFMIGKKTAHFTEVDVEREKPSGADGCSHAISLEPNDADNITCYVASCSITSYDSFKLRCNFSVEDTEGNCSDAESVCHRGFKEGNCFLPSQVELAEEIRRLELHAYRCTIEALNALGPLSWEQETLVTNLRLSLHISNDEHLMELRNLVSTATSMPLNKDCMSSQQLVDFLREQLNTVSRNPMSAAAAAAAAADADEKSSTSDHGNQSATAAADEKSSTSNIADTELKPAETESTP
ncbi:unnamed protein product [Camellia sinensis]